MAGTCTGPGPCDTTPIGAGNNWVNKVGGLPLYIRAIAQALIRSGHTESEAIQLAVGTAKNWAAGEGKVKPETRARAAKAVAEWEAKKVAAHSLSNEEPSMSIQTRVRRAFGSLKPAAVIELTAPVPHMIELANGPMANRLLPDEAAVRKACAALPKLAPGLRATTKAMIQKRAKELGMDSLNLSNIDLAFNPAEARGVGGKWTAGQSSSSQNTAAQNLNMTPAQLAQLARGLGISVAQLTTEVNSGKAATDSIAFKKAAAAAKAAGAAGASAASKAATAQKKAAAAAASAQKKASTAAASAQKKAATASASAQKKAASAATSAQNKAASAAKTAANQATSAAKTAASSKASADAASAMAATTASTARAKAINSLGADDRNTASAKAPPAGFKWAKALDGSPTLVKAAA